MDQAGELLMSTVVNVRLLTLRKAFKLELMGLQRHGRSVYSIVKEEFNFTGGKRKVYELFNKHVTKVTGIEG